MLREQKERNFSQQIFQPLKLHNERIKEMANNVRWFTGELGIDILGEDFYRQVLQTDNQQLSGKEVIPHISCEAVSLINAAETGNLYFGRGKFPTLYDINPTGLMPFLVKLGYVRDDNGILTVLVSEAEIKPHFTSLTIVHPNKLFDVRFTRFFTDQKLSNSLNINYLPFKSNVSFSNVSHTGKMDSDNN